jgi:predicted amidophosphoribosyltransferase
MKKRKPFLLASPVACRHCGSPFNSFMCHGHARHDGTPFDLIYQVLCEKCRASGPIAKTAREAIAAWEHHAAAPLAEAPAPDCSDSEFEEEEKTA